MRTLSERTARLHSWRAPLALTLIIAFAGLFATSPLRGMGGAVAVPATLRLSPLYIILAPWCDVLDALTLMSVRQHIALLVTLFVAFSLWRSFRRGTQARLRRELLAFAGFAVTFSATYAIGGLLPRPMASLRLLNRDAVAVDFHSHTRASWDGRHSFSSESNRSWHRDAGFNASYISDHGTLTGVIEGESQNPGFSGDGTVILPAVEVRCEGQHVVILGATIHEGTPDCSSATIPAASVGAASRGASTPGMITLLTLPARLALDRRIPQSEAIEISDGAPRALDQMQRDGALIRRVAKSNDLAVVASSNNHGWGRTAAAWSVLEIPHWRSFTPSELDAAIRSRLATRRGKSVYVVERRRVVPPTSSVALIETLPLIGWNLLTTLSSAERISWIVWTWTLWALLGAGFPFAAARVRYLAGGSRPDEALRKVNL